MKFRKLKYYTLSKKKYYLVPLMILSICSPIAAIRVVHPNLKKPKQSYHVLVLPIAIADNGTTAKVIGMPAINYASLASTAFGTAVNTTANFNALPLPPAFYEKVSQHTNGPVLKAINELESIIGENPRRPPAPNQEYIQADIVKALNKKIGDLVQSEFNTLSFKSMGLPTEILDLVLKSAPKPTVWNAATLFDGIMISRVTVKPGFVPSAYSTEFTVIVIDSKTEEVLLYSKDEGPPGASMGGVAVPVAHGAVFSEQIKDLVSAPANAEESTPPADGIYPTRILLGAFGTYGLARQSFLIGTPDNFKPSIDQAYSFGGYLEFGQPPSVSFVIGAAFSHQQYFYSQLSSKLTVVAEFIEPMIGGRFYFGRLYLEPGMFMLVATGSLKTKTEGLAITTNASLPESTNQIKQNTIGFYFKIGYCFIKSKAFNASIFASTDGLPFGPVYSDNSTSFTLVPFTAQAGVSLSLKIF